MTATEKRAEFVEAFLALPPDRRTLLLRIMREMVRTREGKPAVRVVARPRKRRAR